MSSIRSSIWKALACLTLVLTLSPVMADAGSTSRSITDPDAPVPVAKGAPAPAEAPQSISVGKWTNLFPALSAVDAISSTDAWAAGDDGHLAHYTGTTWVDVDPANLLGISFSDIDMVSPTSGWLGTFSQAFQYDGTNWNERSTGLADLAQLKHLSAASANDVWAIGYGNQVPYSDVIIHWNGSSWVDSGTTISTTASLSDIYMNSSTDGWIVGTDYPGSTSAPLVRRYNGTTWSAVSAPPTASSLSYAMSPAPGELWAAGVDTALGYAAYSYIGGTWTAYQLNPSNPYGAFPYGIYMQSSAQGWVITNQGIVRWDGSNWTFENTSRDFSSGGIAGAGGQVWAVGGGDTVMNHAGVGNWVLQRGGPTSSALRGASAVSASDVWAVGDGGTIVHYDGSTWQRVPTSFTSNLYDVQMLSATDGYAVGNSIVAHWDGSTWTQVAAPSGGLRDVYMLNDNEGWAVGASGRIFHDLGGTWTQATSPATRELQAVWMDSPTHGWAGGGFYSHGQYVLLEYDGVQWIDRSSTLPQNGPSYIRDIWMNANGSEGWAVGYTGSFTDRPILHYSGGTWSVVSTVAGNSGFNNIVPEALGEFLAVGCEEAHRVGTAWQEAPMPVSICQFGFALTPGRGGWAVGVGGSILQYNPLTSGQRFYDVQTNSTFYQFIECMASRGIISGYAQDNTFRPGNNVTRGQLSKIIALSANYSDPPGIRRFQDVPPGSTFYTYTQQLANRSIIGGYACGGSGEPCEPGNLPYFRPNNNATRGQISKIDSNAAGFSDTPTGQQFEDIAVGSTFYTYTYRLVSRAIMSGYACGGPGEPCGPGNLPYFQPNNNATRGQTAKIVTNTFFPGCQTPNSLKR